jgi:hypothetical protein
LSNSKGQQRVFLKDANLGTLIGQDFHFDNSLPNLYTSETSEKTKLIEIDKEGFNLYMRGYLQSRYDKIISLLNGAGGYLKSTRSNFGAFMNLVMMINTRKVLNNTIIIK